MTTTETAPAATGTLLEKTADLVVLGVPGTDYRIHLKPTAPVAAEVGDRIRGVIRAHARRIDICHTGGAYIDPVYGRPRNIQGRVIGADLRAGSIVVKAAVPFVTRLRSPQRPDDFPAGELVTFAIDPGATFTPIES
ncbi:MAG: hypothetical protein ACF8PN_00040 [Phycisphaerales bacterium]